MVDGEWWWAWTMEDGGGSEARCRVAFGDLCVGAKGWGGSGGGGVCDKIVEVSGACQAEY